MDTLPFEVRKVDVRNGALSTSSTLAPFCAAEIEQAERPAQHHSPHDELPSGERAPHCSLLS